MAIDRLAYKLVLDHKQFVEGAVASRKELNLAKQVMVETQTPAQRYQKQVESLGALLKKGAIDQKQYNEAVRQLKTHTMSASAGLGRMKTSLVGVATSLAGVTLGVSGLGLAVRAAAGSFSEFQKNFTRSTAIMGDVSEATLAKMKAVATDVAYTVEASAADAAKGYFFLASAGLTAEESIAALPRTAKFAQAGQFDLALATDLLTDAQSALGLSIGDTAKKMANMDRVADVLTKANILANASVQQFSEALTTKAGAAIKAANKDIEEGVAVLAAFADQGLKGAEAGTALSIVFRDLQTKAILNAEAFRKQGVSVFDATGQMRNVSKILADLEKQTAALSVEARKKFLLDIGFTDKSVGFIQALIGTSEQIGTYERKLRDSQGTTDDVANRSMPGMTKAINAAKAGWDEFAGIVLPALGEGFMSVDGRPLEVQIREFNDAVKEMTPLIETVGRNFGTWAKNIGVVSEAIGGITRKVGQLDAWFKKRGVGGLPNPFVPDLAKGKQAFDLLITSWKEAADWGDNTIGKRVTPGTANKMMMELFGGTPQQGAKPTAASPVVKAIADSVATTTATTGLSPIQKQLKEFNDAQKAASAARKVSNKDDIFRVKWETTEDTTGESGADKLMADLKRGEEDFERLFKPAEMDKRFAEAVAKGSQRDIEIRAAAMRPGAIKGPEERSVDLLGRVVSVLESIDMKTEGVVVTELTELSPT